MSKEYKFIDLFAGIGGFHIGMSNIGMRCVYVSEIDKFARKTYIHNFKEKEPWLFEESFVGDITKINATTIPDFDVLCAGFPCQPFSMMGKQDGFNDIRGTLFFDIARIIKEKQPQAFFLENVRALVTHDNGNTFATIKKTLEDLGYSFYYKIIKATDFNCPQHRPRVYIVGFKNLNIKFKFPEAIPLTKTMSDIFGGKCTRDVGFTLRVGGKGSPITDRRNWDGYIVNDKEVRLDINHAKLMQGFPITYTFQVSKQQAMKQIGNAVAIPVIEAIGLEIRKCLEGEDLS
jgi:DNA (cytosine-5)-methyltransferase 1